MAIRRSGQQYTRTLKHARAYNEAWGALCGDYVINPTQDQGSEEIVPPPANTAAVETVKVPRGTLKPKPRKEWREQEDIYKWTQNIQQLKGHVMMIGNEGRRNVVQAAVSRRMGLLAGASDLFIAKPVGKYAGLWLEVKKACEYTKAQRNTDHWKRQEAFQERMRSVGYAAAFAFGAKEGIALISQYLAGTLHNKD